MGLGPACAEVPRKQPLGRYAELWSKSPFTVPAVKTETEVVEENPLEDYTLAGVCELEGGWFVVLINKKKREERIRIKPNDRENQEFKVLSVNRGENARAAKVQIAHGSKTGWVEYDEKFLVLKKAAPVAPQGQRPGGLPGQAPGQTQEPGPGSNPGLDPGRAVPSPPPLPTRTAGQPARAASATPPTPGGGPQRGESVQPAGYRGSPSTRPSGGRPGDRSMGDRSYRGRGRGR